MSVESHGCGGDGERPAAADYQPPKVEQVLTPAELEHEILYAGIPQTAR